MKCVEKYSQDEVLVHKFGSSLYGEPKLFSHVYYVDGLLIDTGHIRMSDDIFATVKDLNVRQILITHYHEDHSGNIARLQSHFQCPVYASQLCCEIMKNPPPISFGQKWSWGDRPAYFDLIPIADSIKTPKYNFQIIPIPGHAIDMVALYEPSKAWLFSADLYVNSFIGYFLEDESMLQQIYSIRKILGLDFELMFCGHNPQFNEPKKKLKKKLDFLEGFYQQVSELHQEGRSGKEIFKKMKLKEYRFIKFMSKGMLSKMNMVNAVLRDLEGTR